MITALDTSVLLDVLVNDPKQPIVRKPYSFKFTSKVP